VFSEDVTYAAEQLKQLVGGKITDTVVASDGESYGFVVKTKGGTEKVCWVDCDPEGNGPGWLQIEEQKNEPETASG
jgi:hypothetical protein